MTCLRLQLHGAIYRPNSFVLVLRYCANLKAIRYESTSLIRIVADKSYRVIVALDSISRAAFLLSPTSTALSDYYHFLARFCSFELQFLVILNTCV